MVRIQCQSKPPDVRLSYFSAPKPLTRVRQYTLSPNPADEVKSHNRKIPQPFLDCDCACAGRK